MDQLLDRLKAGEVLHIPNAGQTNVNWEQIESPSDAKVNGRGVIAFFDRTGALFYTNGPGWSGLYKDFADFHGRQIALKVSSGYIEVTATIDRLDDLSGVPAGFFDATGPGGDPHPIHTVILTESELRAHLLEQQEPEWPPVTDGPLEGVVRTEVVLDRNGQVQYMHEPISDNPALKDAAAKAFRSMRFQPVLQDGAPVQAVARISMHFKTTRPTGTETFESARYYFGAGRKATYLAYNNGQPYVLGAEFRISTANGIETGRYQDTWLSSNEWKREIWLGSSHVARARQGNKYYRVVEGEDAPLLMIVLTAIEPIPTADTMTESDWRIRRDQALGAIRVMRGPEAPDGSPQPNAQAFWFAPDGHLIRSLSNGLEIVPSNWQPYEGTNFPRTILASKAGNLVLQFNVTEIGPTPADAAKRIALKGHEWQRAFTADER